MSNQIIVPSLGESVTEATVSKWLKQVGETVDADEPVVELESDKVNLELPSFTTPSNEPTSTVSPSFALIDDNVPLKGEGTSILTLSVSNSTKGSSESTVSPTCLSHLDTVASVTDSPKEGTII